MAVRRTPDIEPVWLFELGGITVCRPEHNAHGLPLTDSLTSDFVIGRC
nr:hypothetical protein [Paenibacillus sp. GP183]